MKIIVTTYPFSETNENFKYLDDHEIQFNNYKRKMSPDEVYELMKRENPELIIAGTEKYNKKLLDVCTNLKMISRVGIGMDSVDLNETNKRGIVVTNTPDAPTNAVAELTIGQIINLLRKTEYVSQDLKQGGWDRYIGREIRNCNIGIIGCGRIGYSVINKLIGFNPKSIKIHDIDENRMNIVGTINSSKEEILKNCDVISIHIPLTDSNLNYIDTDEFNKIKKDCVLINTSRGGIINENNLYKWLYNNSLGSASLDVFEIEPYREKLCQLDNISLTPHLGSCTVQSRKNMEGVSIKKIINYIKKI